MSDRNVRVIQTQEEGDKFFFGDKYFAFLDVLGFSDLVRYNSHNALVSIYDSLINTPVRVYSEFNQKDAENKRRELGENVSLSGLRVVNISDSIILWTENSKQSSILEILYAVKLFLSVSMRLGIPLRGAVTKGNIEIFENNGIISMVGSPIVHAAELEKKQQWSGCIVDTGIVTFLRSFEKVVMQRDILPTIERTPQLLVSYDNIPYREGVKAGYAINWVHQDMTEASIRAAFVAHNKKSEKIEDKIANTIQFFQYCRKL